MTALWLCVGLLVVAVAALLVITWIQGKRIGRLDKWADQRISGLSDASLRQARKVVELGDRIDRIEKWAVTAWEPLKPEEPPF